MSPYFTGLLLIIIIFLPAAARYYVPTVYTTRQKRDTLSILPLTALAVSVILFFAYGYSYTTLAVVGITLLFFLLNLVQFYNYCIGLRREYFSSSLKVLGIIETIILLGFLAVMIYFFPPVLKNKSTEKFLFYGSEKAGYYLKTNLLEKTALKVELYTPYENVHELYTPSEEYLEVERKAIEESMEEGKKTLPLPEVADNSSKYPSLEEIDKSDYRREVRKHKKESQKAEMKARKALQKKITEYQPEQKVYPRVLFIPDVFVSADESAGTLSFLAGRGYEVYSFNYYDGNFPYFNGINGSNLFKEHNFRKENINNPEKLKNRYNDIVNFKVIEYVKSLTLLESVQKLPVYIIAEGHCVEAAQKVKDAYPNLIIDVYEINRGDKIPDYIEGYGNFQQVFPLEAFILKQPRQTNWDNAKRISFFADKHFKKSVKAEKTDAGNAQEIQSNGE